MKFLCMWNNLPEMRVNLEKNFTVILLLYIACNVVGMEELSFDFTNLTLNMFLSCCFILC